MRKHVIAGNWKMYKLLDEAVQTALALKPLVANSNHCDVVIAPVFTALKIVADRLEGSNIQVSAQNCATQNEFGPQTGEITPTMLKDVGCSHVIIGHSREAAVLWRNRRVRKQKDKSRYRGGLDGYSLRRRKAQRKGSRTVPKPSSKPSLIGGLQGLTVRRHGTYHYCLRACLGDRNG